MAVNIKQNGILAIQYKIKHVQRTEGAILGIIAWRRYVTTVNEIQLTINAFTNQLTHISHSSTATNFSNSFNKIILDIHLKKKVKSGPW